MTTKNVYYHFLSDHFLKCRYPPAKLVKINIFSFQFTQQIHDVVLVLSLRSHRDIGTTQPEDTELQRTRRTVSTPSTVSIVNKLRYILIAFKPICSMIRLDGGKDLS